MSDSRTTASASSHAPPPNPAFLLPLSTVSNHSVNNAFVSMVTYACFNTKPTRPADWWVSLRRINKIRFQFDWILIEFWFNTCQRLLEAKFLLLIFASSELQNHLIIRRRWLDQINQTHFIIKSNLTARIFSINHPGTKHFKSRRNLFFFLLLKSFQYFVWCAQVSFCLIFFQISKRISR